MQSLLHTHIQKYASTKVSSCNTSKGKTFLNMENRSMVRTKLNKNIPSAKNCKWYTNEQNLIILLLNHVLTN